MSDTNTSIMIDLEGNLEVRAQRFGNAIERMSQRSQRQLGALRKTTLATSRTFDSLGDRYIASLGGTANAEAIKGVRDLQTQMARLKTDANLTGEQIDQLRESLLALSADPQVRIAPQLILSAFNDIALRTGDIDFANANLKNISLTMQGLGADSKSTGKLLSEYWNKKIRAPEDVLATNDRLFAQFELGNISLGKLASLSPQLFSAIKNQGPEAITQASALAQVFSKTIGSAELSVSGASEAMGKLFEAGQQKLLQGAGIELFKPGSLTELRDVNGILGQFIDKATSNPELLKKVFGSKEAADGVKSLFNPANMKLLTDLIDGPASKKRGSTSKAAAKNGNLLDTLLDISGIDSSEPRGSKSGRNKGVGGKRRSPGPGTKNQGGEFEEFINVIGKALPKNAQKYLKYAVSGAKVLDQANKLMGNGADAEQDVTSQPQNSDSGKTSSLGGTGKTPLPVWVVNMPGGDTDLDPNDTDNDRGKRRTRKQGTRGRKIRRSNQHEGNQKSDQKNYQRSVRSSKKTARYKTLAKIPKGSGGAGIKSLLTPAISSIAGVLPSLSRGIARINPLINAATTGYEIGTELNKGINAIDRSFDIGIGDAIGRGINSMMAWAGNEDAKKLQATQRQLDAVSGEINISVSDERIKVKSLSKQGEVDLKVDTGQTAVNG